MANKLLGKNLKCARMLANFTQQQIADNIALKSKSTISMWESGNNEPDIITFLSICCAYKLPGAKELVKALGLENTVKFDFTPHLSERDTTEDVVIAKPCVKRFVFCPYCGEKLHGSNS